MDMDAANDAQWLIENKTGLVTYKHEGQRQWYIEVVARNNRELWTLEEVFDFIMEEWRVAQPVPVYAPSSTIRKYKSEDHGRLELRTGGEHDD